MKKKKIGIMAFCKNCVKPRLISPDNLCPGCLKRGSVFMVFDSKTNPMKLMIKKRK